MKFFYIRLFIFGAMFLLIFQSKGLSQLVYTGVDKLNVEPIYSERLNPQWCWAASVQLALAYSGAKISQEDIIKKSFSVRNPYGKLPLWSKSFKRISDNLKHWVIWYNREKYFVSVEFFNHTPSPEALMHESKNNYPVIMADSDSTNLMHAVLCTGVGIMPSYYGTVYKKIIVRDPWPNCQNDINKQNVNWNISDIPTRVPAYWLIHVKKLTHSLKK